MMKFAINYSPQAAELWRQGQIKLDYFKTPPWPDMIAEAEKLRPVRVHFNLRADDGEEPDWEEIETFLAQTSTPYINIHLGITANQMPHIPVDAKPTPQQRREVVARLLASAQALTARFGASRVIAENIPFHTGRDYNLRACSEPEVIAEVVEGAGCGFLLDISHARIAAHYLGMDGRSYIEALPVQHLRELHFTGIHDWSGILTDHLEVLEQDWPWLEWTLEKVKNGDWGQAHMLAFEYGGIGSFFERFSDSQVIETQVPRMYALCHNGSTFNQFSAD